MSCYKTKGEFVERTKKLLKGNSKNSETLFINCCIGLLFIPQQIAKDNNSITIKETINSAEWGIDPKTCKPNTSAKGYQKDSVENIARHFRNSIAHGHFDLVDCNAGKQSLEKIHITDYYKNNLTFDLTLSMKDFRKFVKKYSESLKTEISKL